MNIAIIGYGKMGRLVEETAHQRDVSVVATVDPNGSARYSAVSAESVGVADVCI